MKKRRHSHNRWVFVDADDTVLGIEIDGKKYGTAHAYNHVLDLFQDLMVLYGFNREESLARQREIDMERAKTLGFGDKSRFPISMGMTYVDMCLRHDRVVCENRKDTIVNLGYQVFTYPYVALDGAIDTLKALSMEYNIAIVTKGELKEQLKKVVDSGIAPYSDLTVVLPHKSDEEWQTLVFDEEYVSASPADLALSWAVGNSVKSDVNPPLRLGANGIHLAVGSWLFEDADAEKALPGRTFAVVNNIADILRIIPSVYHPTAIAA